MTEHLRTAERLRADAGAPAEALLFPERILPKMYLVGCWLLPKLSVEVLRDFLTRHERRIPPGLVTCRDRRLRGAVLAWRGHGLLFADRDG